MSVWGRIRGLFTGDVLTRSDAEQLVQKALSVQEEQQRQKLLEPYRATHLPRHQVVEAGGKGPRKLFGYSPQTLRLFVRNNPLIRAAVDIRKREVASAPFDIEPDLTNHEKEIDTLRQLMQSVRAFPDRIDVLNRFEPIHLTQEMVRDLIEVTRDADNVTTQEVRYRFNLALQDLTREAESHAAKVRPLFENPSRSWTWRDVIRAVIPDILILDAGCIEMRRALYPLDKEQMKLGKEVPSPTNEILELHWVDGGTVRPCVDLHGQLRGLEDPHDVAFEQWIDGQKTASGGWKRHELLYLMENPQTDVYFRGYGLSRVETLILTAMLDASTDKADSEEYKRESYGGILQMVDDAIVQEDLDMLKTWWEEEIEGTKRLPMWSGKELKYTPMNPSGANRDKRSMERRMYYMRRICAIFEIAPIKLGFPEGATRATSETSGEMMDDGLRSLLGLWDAKITQHIVHSFGFKDICYRSQPLHLRDEKKKLELAREKMDLGIWDVNDVRMQYGKEPLDIGENSLMFFAEYEKSRGQSMGMSAGSEGGEEGEDAMNTAADMDGDGLADDDIRDQTQGPEQPPQNEEDFAQPESSDEEDEDDDEEEEIERALDPLRFEMRERRRKQGRLPSISWGSYP